MPTEEEVLSQKGLEAVAMNRYQGSIDGLDRGFLNRFTLGGLALKIPLLGTINLSLLESITNEQRAMIRYKADKRAEEMAELSSLLALSGQKAAAEAKP